MILTKILRALVNGRVRVMGNAWAIENINAEVLCLASYNN